jgi:hypothetical protein
MAVVVRRQVPLVFMLTFWHPMPRIRNLEIVKLIDGEWRRPERFIIGEVRKHALCPLNMLFLISRELP